MGLINTQNELALYILGMVQGGLISYIMFKPKKERR